MTSTAQNDLQIRIGADSKSAEQALARFADEYEGLIGSLKKPLGEIDGFIHLKKSLKDTEANFKTAEEECARLARQLRETKDPPKKLGDEFERAKRKAGDLKDSIEAQRTILQELRRSLDAAGISTKNLTSEQIRLKRELQEAEKMAAQNAQKVQALAEARRVGEAAAKAQAEAQRKASVAARAEAEAQRQVADSHRQVMDAWRFFGIKPVTETQEELGKLQAAYKLLKASGTASTMELARIEEVFTEKTRTLRRELQGTAGTEDALTGARKRAARAALEELEAQQKAADAQKHVMDAYATLGIRPLSEIQAEIQKLRQAYKSLQSSGTASVADLARAEAALTDKTRALQTQMHGTAVKAHDVGKEAGSSLNLAAASADGLSNGLLAVGTRVLATIGTLAGLKIALSELIEMHTQFETKTKAFQAIFGGYGAAAAEMDFVRKESQRLGLELFSTADAYKTISAAAMGTSLQGQKTRDIFTAVAEAARVLGLNDEALSGSLLAIGQMMSKGTVQAEELRGQLGERLPGTFQLAAKAMGMSTAELDKFMAEGKLISDDFLPKFAQVLHEKFGKEVPNATDSTTAAVNRFKNEWNNFKKDFGEGTGIITGFNVIVGELSNMVKLLDESPTRLKMFGREWKRIWNEQETPFDVGNPNQNMFSGLSKLFRGSTRQANLQIREAVSESFAGIGGGLEGPMSRSFDEFTDAAARRIQILNDQSISSMRAAQVDLGKGLDDYTGRLVKGKLPLSEYGLLAQELWEKHSAAAQKSFELSSTGLAKWGEDTKAQFQNQIDNAEEGYRKLSEDYIKARVKGAPEAQGLKEQAEIAGKAVEDLRNYTAMMMIETGNKVTEMAEANLKHIAALLENYKSGTDLRPLLQGIDTLRQQGVLTGEVISSNLVGAFEKLKAVNLQGVQDQLENLKKTGGETSALLRDVLTAAIHKLGMDTDKYLTEMSKAEEELIGAFKLVATNSEASSDTVNHALDTILDKVKSLEAIEQVRQLLLNLRGGKIGPEQIADAMERLKGKSQDAKAAVASLREESTAVGDAFKTLGVVTVQALKAAETRAKAAFEIVQAGYREGKVSLGEYKAAWEAYAQKALATAKVQGGYQEAEIKRTLEAQGAVLGFTDVVEKLGLTAERTGQQGAAGMRAIGDEARKSAEEIRAMKKAAGEKVTAEGAERLRQSADARRDAILEYWNPNTSVVRGRELQQQMLRAGVSWDDLEALKIRTEGEAGASSQTPSNLGFSYQVPHWELMGDAMRKRVKAAVLMGNQPGMSEAAKDEERKLRREMEASLAGLERMKEQLKKAGNDLDEQTGRMLESYVSGAGKNLSKEALAELSSAVESWKTRNEQDVRERAEKERSPEGREQFRTAVHSESQKGEKGKNPVEVQPQKVQAVTIQTERPPEIRPGGRSQGDVSSKPAREEQQAMPPPAVHETLEEPPKSHQPHQPQSPPPESPKGSGSMRGGQAPAQFDDRPLTTLQEIASTLREIEQGVSTLIRIAGGGGSPSPRVRAEDLAVNVLTAISQAAMRS